MDDLDDNPFNGLVVYAKAENDGLGLVYDAMSTLREIDWFKASVRDIRAFKVEDWSDFTQRIKKYNPL